MTTRGLTIENDGGIVRLRGELDMEASPAIEAELGALASREPDGIVVDLSELGFIDSTGIQCLLRASERAHESGETLRFRGAHGQVDEVLRLTGVRDLLPFGE